MNHPAICQWLGLPAEVWPPDHYLLLGLEPGENDSEQIESHVHLRLELFRRYQLAHPEAATEAMNRLAQAFLCLTDPQAKKTYDQQTLGLPEADQEVSADDVLAVPENPFPWLKELDWQTAPPPERMLARTDIPSLPSEKASDVDRKALDDRKLAPLDLSSLANEPSPSAVENRSKFLRAVILKFAKSAPRTDGAANESSQPEPPLIQPRRPSTKRTLFRRVVRVRKLMEAWGRAGKYLGHPKRRLAKPGEATELIRQMEVIRAIVPQLPAVLGEAGQPGYLVMMLARQSLVVPTFQTLLPSQRQKLADDWRLSMETLRHYRESLRAELKTLRKKSPAGIALRSVRSFLHQPGSVLLLVGLIALNLAVWRHYFSAW